MRFAGAAKPPFGRRLEELGRPAAHSIFNAMPRMSPWVGECGAWPRRGSPVSAGALWRMGD